MDVWEPFFPCNLLSLDPRDPIEYYRIWNFARTRGPVPVKQKLVSNCSVSPLYGDGDPQ